MGYPVNNYFNIYNTRISLVLSAPERVFSLGNRRTICDAQEVLQRAYAGYWVPNQLARIFDNTLRNMSRIEDHRPANQFESNTKV